MSWFKPRWKVGEHIIAVGETGSGKTTLLRNILLLRSFVIVLGTKRSDPDLYPALEDLGFVRKDSWNPYEWEDTHERYVIFAPTLNVPRNASEREEADAEVEQAEKFRRALAQINESGGWCIDSDEIATIVNDMGIKRTINRLYREGRSEHISLVAGTQRPREIPLVIFQNSKWFFMWQIADQEDRRRASEYTGPMRAVVDYTAARMPRYEFLCLHKPTQEIVRSRVGG